MRIRTGRRRLTLLELVLVTTVVATLAALLCPVLLQAQSNNRAAEGEAKRLDQCKSNVRQISLAIQMYAQDNNAQYPGIDGTSWVTKVSPYLGDKAAQIFTCPSEGNEPGKAMSYALSGLLIRQDGTGVKEAQIMAPSEVGALCDAVPSGGYPAGRVIGGGGMKRSGTVDAFIAARHSKGAVVGFCDGHVKYFQGPFNRMDEGNGAIRALYHAAPLELIDNPVAMLPHDAGINGLTGTVTVGGEYAMYPLLMAAAKVYGSYYTSGFKGQLYNFGRPTGNWVWGAAGTDPDRVAPKAIAYDAVCIIVSKGSKIPTLPALVNGTYAMPIPAIRELFEIGYQQNVVQLYKMDDWCSTNTYVKKVIGLENTGWGIDIVVVANDAEMIEKVSNDPWAIGYCSSAFADPDRVVVLAPVIDGKIYVWPRADKRLRWVMPAFAESDWPWKRHLDAASSGDRLANGIIAALRYGGLKQGLHQGPLFTWGYWPGSY
ncbi:MAG: H-X9-DG-CTERM domain-containing protein [Armatimonadota bacterium]